jgi:alkyl hydroperoxide reductase subunit AhpF
MVIISDQDQEFLRKHFEENLSADVEILMFTERQSPIIIPGKQTCETCEQTEALLKEVAALSDKIKLRVLDISAASEEAAEHGIDRVPAIVAKGAARGRVRFFGIPAGYEFSGFIADLVDTAAGTTDLSDETRAFLASLTEDVNIKVFTTPT